MIRFRAVCAVSLFALSAAAQTPPTQPPGTLLEDPFRLGAILVDTNGDKLADALCGHILVPKSPSVADNTSAANLAARLGFETSALTLPIVVSAPTPSGKFCPAATPDLFVGRESLAAAEPAIDPLLAELQIGEGGVFAVPGGILFAAPDASGLIAAADFYSAHAPFQGSVTGERLQAIARTVNARLTAQKVDASVTLVALTYTSAQSGLHRAVLQVTGTATPAAIRAALVPAEGESPLRGIAARELQLRFASAAPLTLAISGARTAAPAPAAAAAPAGAGPAAKPACST